MYYQIDRAGNTGNESQDIGDGDFSDPGDGKFYALTDRNYSVVSVLGEAGGLKERVRYLGYGSHLQYHARDSDGDRDWDSADGSYTSTLIGATISASANYDPDADINRDGSIGMGDIVVPSSYPPVTPPGDLSDPDIGNIVGYAGYLYEKHTGLYLARHRWLDPKLGRWLNRDPIGYAAGDSNLYGYVGGSPLNYVDPMGLDRVFWEDAIRPTRVNGRPAQLHFKYREFEIDGSKSYELLDSSFTYLDEIELFGKEALDSRGQSVRDREILESITIAAQRVRAGGEIVVFAGFVIATILVPGPEDVVLAGILSRVLTRNGLRVACKKNGERVIETIDGALPDEELLEQVGKDLIEEVIEHSQSKIPSGWVKGPANEGFGTKMWDPNNPSGMYLRIDGDHVHIRSGGKVIGRDGKPILECKPTKDPRSHIPLDEWIKWKRWDSP